MLVRSRRQAVGILTSRCPCCTLWRFTHRWLVTPHSASSSCWPVSLASTAFAAPLRLAAGGKTRYVIVVDPDAIAAEKHAAEELGGFPQAGDGRGLPGQDHRRDARGSAAAGRTGTRGESESLRT